MINPIQKILLMGLSNSGKTSVLQYFQGIRNLPAFCNVKPTVNVNWVKYQAVDQENIVWDFGGQIKFIEEYLEKFYEYLTDTDEILFIIDIQEIEKYKTSLGYLKRIVELLVKNNSMIEITIFLHKYDPDLFEVHPEITEEKIKNLIDSIHEIFPKKYKYAISKTSIYAKFKEIKV